MKKECLLFAITIILVSSLACFVIAIDETTTNANLQLDQNKTAKAFECLENNTAGKANIVTFEEAMFIILASPKSSVLTEYKNLLINKTESVGTDKACWPKGGCKIKETALAVLALNHLGEDTQKGENWLLSKNKTASEITWLLQEESSSETRCKMTYDNQDYSTIIGIDKKITSGAGSCLSIYSNSFWFQISPNCYDKEFVISCDRDFLVNLLYKRQGSGNTYYVDSNTQSPQALGLARIKVDSKCFGLSTCEYEGSLWATLALLRTGNDIKGFIPYLTALAESNKAYLPEAFLYMITSFEDYANVLIQNQELGNYWIAENSVNGKFYDTALALIALKSSSSDQVARARKQMEFFQDSSGCWISPKKIRDTAILLWALEGRAPSILNVNPSTDCLEARYFCMDTPECPATDQLPNYWCGYSQMCCRTENLKTCEQLNGEQCATGKVCDGNVLTSSDITDCCVAGCIIPVETTECEDADYYCKTSCSSSEEETGEACDTGMICCKSGSDSTSSGGKSKAWIWLLIIGIIILLAAIIYLQRDRLRMWWFKRKNGVKSEGSSNLGAGFGRPSFPPFGRGMPPAGAMSRPMSMGSMPARQMPMRPAFTQARPVVPVNKPAEQAPPEDDETFKKLREMSK